MLDYSNADSWPGVEDLEEWETESPLYELQEAMPNLLKETLLGLWGDRNDWFFGLHLPLYYHLDDPPLLPDGFLSLGVERVYYDENLRPGYAIWEEKVTPLLVLEIVSPVHRGEYTQKKYEYGAIGIPYYVIYSFHRRRNPRLEINKLIDGIYETQPDNPLWIPEIALGIGLETGNYGGVTREWLYWYNEQGQRYPTPLERVQAAEARAACLAQRLQELGIDPDALN